MPATNISPNNSKYPRPTAPRFGAIKLIEHPRAKNGDLQIRIRFETSEDRCRYISLLGLPSVCDEVQNRTLQVIGVALPNVSGQPPDQPVDALLKCSKDRPGSFEFIALGPEALPREEEIPLQPGGRIPASGCFPAPVSHYPANSLRLPCEFQAALRLINEIRAPWLQKLDLRKVKAQLRVSLTEQMLLRLNETTALLAEAHRKLSR